MLICISLIFTTLLAFENAFSQEIQLQRLDTADKQSFAQVAILKDSQQSKTLVVARGLQLNQPDSLINSWLIDENLKIIASSQSKIKGQASEFQDSLSLPSGKSLVVYKTLSSKIGYLVFDTNGSVIQDEIIEKKALANVKFVTTPNQENFLLNFNSKSTQIFNISADGKITFDREFLFEKDLEKVKFTTMLDKENLIFLTPSGTSFLMLSFFRKIVLNKVNGKGQFLKNGEFAGDTGELLTNEDSTIWMTSDSGLLSLKTNVSLLKLDSNLDKIFVTELLVNQTRDKAWPCQLKRFLNGGAIVSCGSFDKSSLHVVSDSGKILLNADLERKNAELNLTAAPINNNLVLTASVELIALAPKGARSNILLRWIKF